MALVIYLGAYDKKMSYRLRNKEPQSLHQAFQKAMDIEGMIKYGLVKFHNSENASSHEAIYEVE